MTNSSDNQTSTSGTTERAPQKPRVGMSRRQLLRAGIATAPVMLTLASRPVLGGDIAPCQCVTPSAFCSLQANPMTSTAGKSTVACAGLSPGYWKNHAESWPSPFVAEAEQKDSGKKHGPGFTPDDVVEPTLFHSNTTGFDGSIFGDDTMMQVLNLQDGGAYAVGRHVTAALLNARAGNVSMPDERIVAQIWNEFVNYGYYSPMAGVQWGASQIIDYLDNTMT